MKAMKKIFLFELKKHFKLLTCSVLLIYFLKYLLYIIHKDASPKPVNDALVLMFFIGSAITVYMASSVFSGEREKNTLILLFTREVDRKSIITGKILSVFVLPVLFILLTIPALTPSPVADPHWIPMAVKFIYNDIFFFTGLIFTLTGIPFLMSSFCKTITSAFLYSLIAICLFSFFIMRFLSPEIIWHTNIFAGIIIIFLINICLGQGEIIPEKAVLKKYIKKTGLIFVLFLIFFFFTGLYFDAFKNPGPDNRITNVLPGLYKNSIITKRTSDSPACLNFFNESDFFSKNIDKIKTDKKNEINVKNENWANWKKILKRNQTPLGISPDGTLLLYEDKRHFFGLINTDTPSKIKIIDNDKHILLGTARHFSFRNSSFEWIGNNRLAFWLNNIDHKYNRKSKLANLKKFTLCTYSPDKGIREVLHKRGFILKASFPIGSGRFFISELQNENRETSYILADLETGKSIDINNNDRLLLKNSKLVHTCDTRALFLKTYSSVIIDFKKITEQTSLFNDQDLISNLDTEIIEHTITAGRLNSKGWIFYTKNPDSNKNKTLFTLQYKDSLSINSKIKSKEILIDNYTFPKIYWHKNNMGLSILLISANEFKNYKDEYKKIIEKKEYKSLPFYYTLKEWDNFAASKNAFLKICSFSDKTEFIIQNKLEKEISVFDYFNAHLSYIKQDKAILFTNNNIHLIDN